jgi:dihydrofolate reductase
MANTTTSNTRIVLIAAVGRNNELGRNNDLMWRLKSDMAFFKRTTLHHRVIMGRKSWESLPIKFRPLPKRINVVISRDEHFQLEGALTFQTFEAAISDAKSTTDSTAFIIGGGQIYTHCLQANLVDEMYLTHVDAAFSDADVFFPAISANEWKQEIIETFEANEDNEYAGRIVHYVKI